jgi:hypothetical protein
MWWLVLLFVVGALYYAHTTSKSMVISSKGDCSSCPKRFAKEKGF